MKQLENGIKWHEEQRKTNAGKTPAPAPAVPKVKGIGALKGLEVVVAGSTGSRGLDWERSATGLRLLSPDAQPDWEAPGR